MMILLKKINLLYYVNCDYDENDQAYKYEQGNEEHISILWSEMLLMIEILNCIW